MTSKTPQYQKLLNKLMHKIGDGTYPVGSLLPTEHQLCQQFKLSRFTVREAMRRLTEMGMVVRLTRQGTRVVAERPAAAYVQPLDSIGEVMMHVRDTRLNIVAFDIVAVDAALATQLHADPGSGWLHVCGTREALDDGLPLSWADIYVPDRFSGVVGDLGTLKVPIFELIEARYGERIAEIEQEISATTVPPATAMALRVRPNSPALLVRRRSYNENREIVEVSINIQPSSRYTFSLNVKRDRTSIRHQAGEPA